MWFACPDQLALNCYVRIVVKLTVVALGLGIALIRVATPFWLSLECGGGGDGGTMVLCKVYAVCGGKMLWQTRHLRATALSWT